MSIFKKLNNFICNTSTHIIAVFYTLLFIPLTLPWFILLNLSFLSSILISFLFISVHRIIDYYSTYIFSKEFDRDFRKYKLEKYYREMSPLLPKHPTKRSIFSYKNIFLTLFVFVILFGLPTWWYQSYDYGTTICFSFLMSIPIIYLNNTLVTYDIRNSKRIAKEVESCKRNDKKKKIILKS